MRLQPVHLTNLLLAAIVVVLLIALVDPDVAF